MPCDTIQTSQVEFLAKSTDASLLEAGLRALGYTVETYGAITRFSRYGRTATYEHMTGKLTMPEEWDSNAVKRAYSEQVVNTTAKKNGWKVEWSTNKETGQREATVERRA